MASNDSTPPKHIIHDQNWQILIEFSLPIESGSEHLATNRVVEAVQTLSWPVAHQERLKFALSKAMRNVLQRSHPVGTGALLIIRVLIPEGSDPNQGQIPEKATQQVSRSSSRGWGFFLVQKQGDTPQTLDREAHHLIELFLYQERVYARKHKPNHLT